MEKELRAEIEKVSHLKNGRSLIINICSVHVTDCMLMNLINRLWHKITSSDQVGSLNREQQAVMQTNMNKAPASQV